MNKTVHRYEQKRLEKCVTVGFSVKSRKERSFMSDSAILRSGFVTAWPVGEESDTGREFSIRLTPSSRFSLSLSLSLCLSIRGGQCRTRIMHALFGVALRRENQASPPSFASKSLATIFHDGSTTCCARGAEPVRALRCVRQTRT